MSWTITPQTKVPVDLQGFGSVSLLLHGDGANGSTTITDSSPTPKTVTAVGNAQISTAQSKFGGASIAFDGTGDYCTIATDAAFGFGTADSTVETWVYPASLSGVQVIADLRPFGSGGLGFAVYLNGETLSVARSRTEVLQTGGTLTTNAWHHIAWSRQGSSNRLFLNGVLTSTVTNLTDYPATTLYLGTNSIASPSQFFNGYIDELRITKGVARYVEGTGANAGKMVFAGTNTLALPTAPFPDI